MVEQIIYLFGKEYRYDIQYDIKTCLYTIKLKCDNQTIIYTHHNICDYFINFEKTHIIYGNQIMTSEEFYEEIHYVNSLNKHKTKIIDNLEKMIICGNNN